MKADVRNLLNELMNGCYLRRRVNQDGKVGFTLYASNVKALAVRWLKESEVKPLNHVLLKK